MRAAFGMNVELFVKPEMRSEFLEVVKNNQKGCKEDESLCLPFFYKYGESTAEENKFLLHGEYEDGDAAAAGKEECFEAHRLLFILQHGKSLLERMLSRNLYMLILNFFRTAGFSPAINKLLFNCSTEIWSLNSL